MLRRTKSCGTDRRGAAAVEAALVMSIFLMLLFGVYEYCRFLMVLHVANNAARDASRYATVNVGCDPSQVATMKTNVLNYATTRMGSVNQNLIGYQVFVYPCTSSCTPKSLSTTTPANPFNASDPNNPPWNQAAFTERIAVTIQGNYQPVTPLLLLLPSSIPVSITAVTGSEG